jgi:Domain of unknown function (DUF6438)
MIHSKINSCLIIKCFFILGFLLNTPTESFSQFHNQIEYATTLSDVNSIIYKTIHHFRNKVTDSITFESKDCKKLFDSLQIKTWVKRDFDNNGYTDLFAISNNNRAFCILDSGENRFYLKGLTILNHNCQVFSASEQNNLINFYQISWVPTNQNPPYITEHYTLKKEQLIYKFNGFLEYNESPKDYGIQSIEYDRKGCYGRCPSFKLNIYADKSIRYEPKFYTKAKSGIYFGKMDDKTYQTLIDCLNYINFPFLENEYALGWLDTPESILKITYNNGKTKAITDHALIGTFGLIHFNQMLLDFTENHNWEK